MKLLRLLSALGLVTAAALSAGACADQAEGERCDVANGDSDCAAGLHCKAIAGADKGAAACCPISGPSTAAACSQTATLNTDAGSGTGGASAADAGSGGAAGSNGGAASGGAASGGAAGSSGGATSGGAAGSRSRDASADH